MMMINPVMMPASIPEVMIEAFFGGDCLRIDRMVGMPDNVAYLDWSFETELVRGGVFRAMVLLYLESKNAGMRLCFFEPTGTKSSKYLLYRHTHIGIQK
jgi:hypothetical protein